MTLPLALLERLLDLSATEAWKAIVEHAWSVCAEPLGKADPWKELSRRERELGAVDLFLSDAGWDLWEQFEKSVEPTADALATWWKTAGAGRAVLILDGLSLREVPWLLHGARTRGYAVRQEKATAAELPPETTPFARALGFEQRSALQPGGGHANSRLPGARTDCLGIAWEACAAIIGAEPDWLLWHEWPDSRIHGLAGPGQGLEALAQETASGLTSDGFWALVERLTTGRRLVVTSDHGYAASGMFSDVAAEPGQLLKARFGGRRCTPSSGQASGWNPPVELQLESRHGLYGYAVGRRKWKVQGGYPTLTHGGLSLLEVVSPFVELSR